MKVIDERTAASLVTIDDAIAAVRSAFRALHDRRAEVFPVAGGSGSDPANRVAVKSARLDGIALGVKVGTYWPANVDHGGVAQASTVLLLDDSTGYPLAVVGASHLTALRTAAVDAVAVDALAPPLATTLAVVGTGHQAFYDALAISRVRSLADVAVWGRRVDRARAMVDRLVENDLPARAADSLVDATGGATILTTVTAAHEPLVDLDTVGSVRHLSAMGADSPGKQELSEDLVASCWCVADVVDQSVTIGELQHATAAGRVEPDGIATLGAVLAGRASPPDGARTLFDSSGIAIQDLAAAALAYERLA